MNTKSGDFNEKCYELLKRIPEGKVTTYGEIAKALDTKAYRAVGNAMAKNKYLFVIPCHRVIKSNGVIGHYALGQDKKIKLLLKEGVAVKNGKVKNFEKVIYRFS